MKTIVITLGLAAALALGLMTAAAADQRSEVPAGSNPGAAKTPVPLPSVDEVLERNLRAVGGKEALLKVNSRALKGTVKMTGLNVKIPWQMLSKAPNKSLSLLGESGQASMEGYNGRVAWSKAPLGAVREKTGDELELMKREYEFHRELKLKSIYPQLTVVGVEAVEGRNAFVVEGKPTTGHPERFYYDTASGLLVRYDSTFESAAGPVNLKRCFRDFRTLDGLVIPYGVTVEVKHPKIEDTTLTVQCTEVKHNVPMDDSQFDKPSR